MAAGCSTSITTPRGTKTLLARVCYIVENAWYSLTTTDMKFVRRALAKNSIFNVLYIMNFFVSFHIFLLLYINSSFLATFVGEERVGLLYIASALMGIAALCSIAHILKRVGNRKSLIIVTLVEFLAVLGLAASSSPLVIMALFLLHGTLYVLMLFSLDVFLESYSQSEENTGTIRGTFLTMQNIALMLAPFVAGLVVGNDEFWKVYALSALFLIPFMFILIRTFRGFEDPRYEPFRLRQTFRDLRKNHNLYTIFMIQFLMRFFFSWMVIYTPIYLHQHIGFAWSEIGLMFTIMLLPYVLIEWPAGKLADTRFGEKELLAIGFVITALGTASMSLFLSSSIVLWTAVLFVTRVGASFLEVLSESYFFKHVGGKETDTIGLFRMARPGAYALGPIVASALLLVIDVRFIFAALGIILLLGLYYSIRLRDTR